MIRLAVWSGPRNISTTMMRSWGNRSDTFVCDEPLYAYYLNSTGKPHPGAADVISHGETDWRKAVHWLTGPIPEGKTVWYQKQMSHHLLPEIDRTWLDNVTNAFLLRHPRDVLTSYLKIVPNPTFEDTGYPQQVEIFEWVRSRLGITPPVLDSRDILDDPRHQLGLMCDALGLDFQESMMEWEPGIRSTDGVWARHWYSEVETSTTFRPYKPKPDQVPPEYLPLYEQCLACYEKLYEHRLH